MTLNKTKTCCALAAATLTMAGALVSPQALAHSKAERIAEAASNKADALEAQLRAMQAELDSLRAAASAPRSDASAEKVQELDQWMQQVKSAPVKAETKDNMVFFRGGFARMDHGRDDLLTGNQFAGNVLQMGVADGDGWYAGAGFDFSLNDNLFGLMDNTEVLAELMFEYKNFGKQHSQTTITTGTNTNTTNPLCTLINLASGDEGVVNGAGTGNCEDVTVTQVTLSAAPKIKFMKGSAFRPWIAPVGLALHVTSPPSNGVTYINPGIMFAGGAEYSIWKDIKLGVDGRYHLTGSDNDGVKIDGFTAGGYLGIGF